MPRVSPLTRFRGRCDPDSAYQKTPTISRIFTNGRAEFDGDYTDDLGDRLRAAFRARVIEQGLHRPAASRASAHAIRSGSMTEIAGTAQSPRGSKTATIIAFRRPA